MPTQTNYQRPIHECVIPDDVDKQGDPTWTNRYRNAQVTPPKPDSAQSSPKSTHPVSEEAVRQSLESGRLSYLA